MPNNHVRRRIPWAEPAKIDHLEYVERRLERERLRIKVIEECLNAVMNFLDKSERYVLVERDGKTQRERWVFEKKSLSDMLEDGV